MYLYIRPIFFSFFMILFAYPDTTSAQTEPFDIPGFIRCGEIACATAYQGEGVDHAQLIVEIWRDGNGLNGTTYRYIYDFPLDGPMTSSFYIGAHLAQRVGGTQGVTLSQGDLISLLPDGPVLLEGLERALNAPYTVNLGIWPGPGELQDIMQEAFDDTPQAFFDWDEANGYAPEGNPPEGGGSGSSHSVNNDLTSPDDHCLNNPEQCGIFLTGVASGLLSSRAPEEQVLLNRAATVRNRFARVVRQGLDRPLDLQAEGRVATTNLSCSTEALASEPNVTACKGRCDDCKVQWETDIQIINGSACVGAANLVGVFFSPETMGGSSLLAWGLTSFGIGSGCAGVAMFATAAQRTAMDTKCRLFCDFYNEE